MEYPKGYWQLMKYINDEANELIRSEVVSPIDLSIWSQEVGEKVFDFYLASKSHSQIDAIYTSLLDKVNLNHKKIKRRVNSPLIRITSLDEAITEETEMGSLVGVE